MKENAVPFSAPSPSPVRSAVQKNPEQHVNVTATPAPTPALISETLTSSANVSENGNIQEAEGVLSFALLDLVVKLQFCFMFG